MQCDHKDDSQTEALFDRILKAEGRLDVLVNNAYGGVDSIFQSIGRPFWEKE